MKTFKINSHQKGRNLTSRLALLNNRLKGMNNTFYELVATMGFQSVDIEIVYMCFFPFSLVGKAKE